MSSVTKHKLNLKVPWLWCLSLEWWAGWNPMVWWSLRCLFPPPPPMSPWVRRWWAFRSFLQGCRWLLPCRNLRRCEPAVFLMLKRVKRVIKVPHMVNHGKWLFHLQCEVMNVRITYPGLTRRWREARRSVSVLQSHASAAPAGQPQRWSLLPHVQRPLVCGHV